MNDTQPNTEGPSNGTLSPGEHGFVLDRVSLEYDRATAVIDAPDRFDILRIPHDLSAFGVDRYSCIGAQLARLELEVEA